MCVCSLAVIAIQLPLKLLTSMTLDVITVEILCNSKPKIYGIVTMHTKTR